MKSKRISTLATVLIVIFCLSFTQSSENDIVGKWKISGMFCDESEEPPKGFSITFLKDHNGYFEHDKIQEKDNFTWNVKSDTLKLSFVNEKGIHGVLFEKTNFTFRELERRALYLEIRYTHFRRCGYELEFVK